MNLNKYLTKDCTKKDLLNVEVLEKPHPQHAYQYEYPSGPCLCNAILRLKKEIKMEI